MKLAYKLTVFAFAAVFATSLFAEQPQPSKPKLSKAEIMEKFRQARIKNRRITGGVVYGLPQGKVIEVINRQSSVPLKAFEAAAESVKFHSVLPIVFVNEKSAKPGIVIELVNEESTPSILSAPDNGWAKLNVAFLLTDKPNVEKVNARVVKQFWRTLGAAMGVGVSAFQPCLMRNMASLKDLDMCKLDRPGPSTLNSINESALFFGVKPLKVANYLKACQEGWAPQPSTPEQVKIWNEVHSIPTNPMKIKYQKQ